MHGAKGFRSNYPKLQLLRAVLILRFHLFLHHRVDYSTRRRSHLVFGSTTSHHRVGRSDFERKGRASPLGRSDLWIRWRPGYVATGFKRLSARRTLWITVGVLLCVCHHHHSPNGPI